MQSRIGSGTIHKKGKINFQFHFMYRRQRIDAAEYTYAFPVLINTTEFIEILCSLSIF